MDKIDNKNQAIKLTLYFKEMIIFMISKNIYLQKFQFS